jgi:putative spermidine/putrescine transport system substrate-binding protein
MVKKGRVRSSGKQAKAQTSPGRRRFLKTAAVTAGAAASTGLIDGFPLVWSQNIKDITLVHVGGSYSAIIDIAKKATEDLGFKVEMQTAPHDALLSRLMTQPNTIDIADTEYFFQYYMIKKGTLQPIDLEKRFKWWDKVVPIFTKGEYPDGKKVSTQGCLPYEVQYVEGPGAKDFAKKPTKWATGVPTVYNADTLGIRPDKVEKIETWADLLNPKFKGKTAIVSVPSIGIMDAAMALEARGDMKYADKGEMSKAEIDKTIELLTKAKKDGQFRAFWKTFDESVNLMAAGETIVQSMWSPAVTAVRSRGIPCYYAPLKEGYRAWASCLGLMSHLKGPKLDAAYEYLNWYMSGWQGAFIAKQGYYSSVLETVKKTMTPDEYDYWFEGKPAKVEIKDPYGTVMEKPGAVRDGGSFWNRMGHVACWNTLMKENVYLIKRWNEFLTA